MRGGSGLKSRSTCYFEGPESSKTKRAATAPKLASVPDESEGEIAAIFTRLRDEVRSGPAVPGSHSGASIARTPLPSRSRAERAWAVTAERPFEHRPTRSGRVRGYVYAPVKRSLRKLMRWYVEPVAAHQRTFNSAALNLIDELAERTAADLERLEQRLESLEKRLGPDRAEPSG
jgi:hypothetical protein